MYSTKGKVHKDFSAFRCIPVRTAKAYVNQSLAPQNAMHSPKVKLYWMPLRKEGERVKCTGGEKLWRD